MLIHSVYFWFKPATSAAVRASFEAGLRRLCTIPEVVSAHIGEPEATPERPVIDNGYDWALILTFADVAAHNRYQEHPTHDAFVEEFRSSWDMVRVYDVGESRR